MATNEKEVKRKIWDHIKNIQQLTCFCSIQKDLLNLSEHFTARPFVGRHQRIFHRVRVGLLQCSLNGQHYRIAERLHCGFAAAQFGNVVEQHLIAYRQSVRHFGLQRLFDLIQTRHNQRHDALLQLRQQHTGNSIGDLCANRLRQMLHEGGPKFGLAHDPAQKNTCVNNGLAKASTTP